MVRPLRFERKTLCLEGRCSIQLSYGRSIGSDSKRATGKFQAVFTIPNKMVLCRSPRVHIGREQKLK